MQFSTRTKLAIAYAPAINAIVITICFAARWALIHAALCQNLYAITMA
ncbi:TPA: hypothetical protein J0610_001064, partial [Escherichia coli]|nr:hypothetical protein [Escherichia coli]